MLSFKNVFKFVTNKIMDKFQSLKFTEMMFNVAFSNNIFFVSIILLKIDIK